jgi:hypothetical protein
MSTRTCALLLQWLRFASSALTNPNGIIFTTSGTKFKHIGRNLTAVLRTTHIAGSSSSRTGAEASRLLKLARAIREQLPEVVSMGSSGRERNFVVHFPWGTVPVRRYQCSLLESLRYHCQSSCSKAENPELARDLACAAAMLAEFPRLIRTNVWRVTKP